MRLIDDDERRARLARRQGLADPVASVTGAVEAVVCLHATEPANVHLAAFARSGATRAQVDAALYDARSVVKQLAMRRTVFAFPRELLPAVWGSAAARVATRLQTRLAKEVEAAGIAPRGDDWLARTTDAVRVVLADGPATTAELRGRVPGLDRRLMISPGKSYGGEFPIASRVLSALAARGDVVRGENAGDWRLSRPRWTLAEDWLGAPRVALAEAAGYAALVRAWLDRFGPGTEADIVWWLGGTKAAVRRALADNGAVEVSTALGPAYVLPEDLDPVAPVEPWAALLPALDPTTMGWKQRDFYLGDHAGKVFDRNGNAGPTAWWGGRIVGGWRQDPDGTVVVVPCERLPRAARDALDARAAALTTWLAGDVVSTIYQSPLVRALRSEVAT
ncbi:winged helix DNA-binding domain-containing protein [Nocardioides terrisoli]|uniref:winged helix DNA-binding domain-containing protein n=1 Tax=Nocardioides terrisoli TaxID=3388267 RepID=UPI00287B6F25|nr:winged helix DNA-binding domain-containing protein [Nocardioides marmorisolisilvae]